MKSSAEYLKETHGGIYINGMVTREEALQAINNCLEDHYKVIDELAARHNNLKELFNELEEKIRIMLQ